jgi:hypothetical protein
VKPAGGGIGKIAAEDGAADVSSFVGFFPLRTLTIDGLYQTGAAYPQR